jgi:hypothetical protein
VLGVLQISGAHKDDGPITDADLEEFALDATRPPGSLKQLTLGAFSGFTTKYRKNGLSWQKWWLRSGQLMVYVTYNVIQDRETEEQGVLARILSSLRTTDT